MSARYTTSVDLALPHPAVINLVTEHLKTQGFGVLTTIDVQATLRKKLGAEVEPQTILGACNPKLAAKGLAGEQALGILLPCNVFVREVEPGMNRVFFTKATALFSLVDNDDVAPLATAVDDAMRAVAQGLAAAV